MNRLRVMLIGAPLPLPLRERAGVRGIAHAESDAPCATDLNEQAEIEYDTADDVDAADALLTGSAAQPDVIVLAQDWPGRFETSAIERLRRLAPLARIWRRLGTWCEGELRSGKLYPGTLRAYWHQWTPRWQRQLARWRGRACPVWGQPLTAVEEENWLADAQPENRRSGLVVVRAAAKETATALADACRSHGYDTATVPPGQAAQFSSATATLWDATAEQAADAELVQRLSRQAGGAPIVALLSFPRGEHCDRAMAAGVAAVIAKPLLLEDLFWYLDRLAASPGAKSKT